MTSPTATTLTTPGEPRRRPRVQPRAGDLRAFLARAGGGVRVSTVSEVVSCLTCHKRVGTIRGCCPSCYTRHGAAVRRGEVTWAQLEERGLVLPARAKDRRRWEAYS